MRMHDQALAAYMRYIIHVNIYTIVYTAIVRYNYYQIQAKATKKRTYES